MTDVFLFGTYYSYNENLDPSRTANREAAKWRSQFKVPQGSTPYGDVNDWWYIGDNVHLIDISDLDYQLKIKEIPFNSNADWLKRVEGTIRVDENYIGINPVVNFFYTPYQAPTETNLNPEPFPAPVVSPRPYLPPSFIDFAEERLELGYDYGAVGGMEFKTQIIEVADDREQRAVTRLLPLGRWQLGDRLYGESEVDKLTEVSYLKEFHTARLGKKQGFRFKDWSDYKAENQLIGIGDGETTQWQLSKAYKAGNATTYRPIQKPVVGTVDIFVDGVNVGVDPDHIWVVDHETGVISNEAPLLNGTVLSANFEFDVPVWFESDELPLTLEKFYPDTSEQYYKLGSVFVVEGRIPFAIPWKIESPPEISEDLDLGIIYQTVEKYKFSTNTVKLQSGYTQRESKREDTRILFDLGDRQYDQTEVDKILGYFWNARGQGAEFPFINLGKNYKVRFNSDQLNLRFEAANEEDALFSLSGLKLQLKEQTLYRLPPFSFSLTTITVNPQDPNDPVITASNPSSSNGGGGGGNGGGGDSYNVGSYVGAVGFNQLPDPNIPASSSRWRAAQMFWAAGTLWLVVHSITNSVVNENWYRRAALYKLDASGNFEYVDASLKNYYSGSFDSSSSTIIRKTPTGISLFMRADASVPFGGGRGATENGLLRFEIRNDGSEVSYFYPDADLKPAFGSSAFRLVKCVAIYGNRAYIDIGSSTSNVGFVAGTFDGLEFVLGNWGTGSNGYPVNSEASTTNPNNTIFKESEPFNIYWKNNFPFREIYHGETLLEKYYRVGQLNPLITYTEQNPDGSILARLFLNQICADDTCTSNFSPGIGSFYSVFNFPNYYDPPTALGRIQRPTNTQDATFKFLNAFSSGTFRRLVADDKGNALMIDSLSRAFFYRAGDTFAIDISSQLPGNLRTNEAPTPYGFAVFSHQGDMFYGSSNETLIFVQPQDL